MDQSSLKFSARQNQSPLEVKEASPTIQSIPEENAQNKSHKDKDGVPHKVTSPTCPYGEQIVVLEEDDTLFRLSSEDRKKILKK